jgi:hypothetical protein
MRLSLQRRPNVQARLQGKGNEEPIMPRQPDDPARPSASPAVLRWEFDPSIPSSPFLEGCDLESTWGLQEAVEIFVHWLEQDRFLTWEAVVCEEQGLPLTARQREALGSLVSFNDSADDQILYIDDLPRPREPWYVVLNQIAPKLLIEPFRTFDVHEEVKAFGWQEIMAALDKHGPHLSLPAGVASYREVVPAEIRHKLWLQYALDMLGGLGQSDDLTLDEEDTWRVDEFIDRLRACKESVAYFGLTLAGLLERVSMPPRDLPLFIRQMQDKLGLASAEEPIADRLR